MAFLGSQNWQRCTFRRSNIERKDRLRLLAAEAALAAHEPALAMHHVRQPCVTWPHCSAVWNVVRSTSFRGHSAPLLRRLAPGEMHLFPWALGPTAPPSGTW